MLEVLKCFVEQKSVKDPNNLEYTFGKEIHHMMNLFLERAEKILSYRSGRYDDYYAWVEIGDPNLPMIGIIGHLDTVDYVSENWAFHPLGDFKEDTLYGRGVVDNKGPVVQALYAMKYVQENEIPLRIRLIVGADEESDFNCMKKYLENKEEMPDFGFVPDAKFPYILSEKGIINMTVSMDKYTFGSNLLELSGGTGTNITPDMARAVLSNGDEIVESGVASHVANDSEDDNAIIHLFTKLAEKAPQGTFLDKLKQLQINNHLRMTVDNHPIIIKPTFVSKEGNRIEITIDTRISPELKTVEVKREILSRLGFMEENVVRVNQADGYTYEENHPAVQLVDKVYHENVELLRPHLEKGQPLRIGGTTYGKYFKNCIVFGPGFPGEHSYAHREDERISLKSFMDGLYIYIKLLEAFVGFDLLEE